MSESLTQQERDALVARVAAASAVVFIPGGDPEPSLTVQAHKLETYLHLLGEYADRLPRVVLGACPFTGAPLKCAFDPFGTDGPWWHRGRTFTPEEPAPPKTFKVLLGALDLRGRIPTETVETVLAGPAVPFVVPALLGLPGMVAVIARYPMANGDIAYPISYYSPEEIPYASLHQFWTRPELWFTNEDGSRGWTVANDAWDFDLAPWIAKGKVKWVRPGDPEFKVVGPEGGETCPFVDLPGERQPQVLGGGELEYDELPSGDLPDPFGD